MPRSRVQVAYNADNSASIVIAHPPLLKTLGICVAAAVVCGAIFTVLCAVALIQFDQVLVVQRLGQVPPIVASFAIGFVFAFWRVARFHFVSTRIEITVGSLSVLVRSPLGKLTCQTWPRHEIFEVRSSGGKRLHIRLRHSPPFLLLHSSSQKMIDEAANVMAVALATVPMAAFTYVTGRNDLTYELPGEAYEIDIRNHPNFLSITIPMNDDLLFTPEVWPWILSAGVLATACFTIFVAPYIPWGRGPILVVLIVVMWVALLYLARLIFRRLRKGPVIITVQNDDVSIDHPARLFRRLVWPRQWITNVFVDVQKGRDGRVYQRFIRMETVHGQSVTFCHGRDSVERRRVAIALREALGLPPLPDSAFVEEA